MDQSLKIHGRATLAPSANDVPLVFTHPDQVIACSRLDIAAKRQVLSAWASDARAVADNPTLRRLETGAIVQVAEILAALRRLDAGSIDPSGGGSYPGRAWPHARGRMVVRGRTRRSRRPDHDDPPPMPALAAVSSLAA